MSAATRSARPFSPHCGELGQQPLEVRTWVRRSCLRMIHEKIIPPRPLPEDDSRIAYIVTEIGVPAGFATFYETTAESLWLDILWIEPGLRRQGLADALLAMFTGYALAEGIDTLQLGHVTDNEPMIALMEKHGWAVDHIVRAKRIGA